MLQNFSEKMFPMDMERLEILLAKFVSLKIIVCGDFFLDQYFLIDQDLAEISLETGLTCHQVATIRNSPGAAGNVANNLAELGVNVDAIGVIGQDGQGFDLKKAMDMRKILTDGLLISPTLMTPTYMKSMLYDQKTPLHEIERIDIKNRVPLLASTEEALIAQLDLRFPCADGLILTDQVQEENCGVLTERVRNRISELAIAFPDKPIFVDSRTRAAKFRNMIVKCNEAEALQITGKSSIFEAACDLSKFSDRGAFITLGERGMMCCQKQELTHVLGISVQNPIDICGAGDSAAAGIICALCAGASFPEAAMIGNLTASITIQQVGTTGVATCGEIESRFRSVLSNY